MKTLNVVGAIIKNNGKILATQRGYGEFEGLWEFPGGKIEKNESPKEALIREIKEELNADIEITKFALNIEYKYPTFYLFMNCFECFLKSDFELLEHKNAKWLNKNELNSVEWIPADIEVVEYLKESKNGLNE